jgi:transposase InsO family protein
LPCVRLRDLALRIDLRDYFHRWGCVTLWGAKIGVLPANHDFSGRAPSFCIPHDVYDNAMAEAWVASFKSELVDGRRFPSFERAEHEVRHWIGFYSEERLHEAVDDLPPAECEQLNYKTDNRTILEVS